MRPAPGFARAPGHRSPRSRSRTPAGSRHAAWRRPAGRLPELCSLRRSGSPSLLLRFQLPLLNLHLFLPMLSTFLLPSPIHKMNTGASLRDRATLPSPLRGLGPSGGYPSRLRSLRSLRAPLGPAVRFAHRRLPVRRCRVLRCRAAAHPLTRRGGCPPVPFPEPFSPTFCSPGWVFSTPSGGSALTPDAPAVRRRRQGRAGTLDGPSGDIAVRQFAAVSCRNEKAPSGTPVSIHPSH